MEPQGCEQRIIETFHQETILSEHLALLQTHNKGLRGKATHLRHQEILHNKAKPLDLPVDQHPLWRVLAFLEMRLENVPRFDYELTQKLTILALGTSYLHRPKLPLDAFLLLWSHLIVIHL